VNIEDDATVLDADASVAEAGDDAIDTTPADATPDAAPDAAPDAKADGGDDWRTQFATEGDEVDKDLLKFLGRYHSPSAAIGAWKKQNDAIASGPWIKPLGEDATEEDIAAYRKQTGVSEKMDGYNETLPEGLVIGDEDRPMVDKFLENMHASNARPDEVNAALKSYYDLKQEAEADVAELEAQSASFGEESLREEWGGDYKRNITAAHSYLDTLPSEVKAIFAHGRMPVAVKDERGEPVLGKDGQAMLRLEPVGYNPTAMKWLTSMALENNPLSTVVPGAGSNQAAAVGEEIANIEKMMGDRTSDYWKGPKADTMQERYRELVDARDKLKARA